MKEQVVSWDSLWPNKGGRGDPEESWGSEYGQGPRKRMRHRYIFRIVGTCVFGCLPFTYEFQCYKGFGVQCAEAGSSWVFIIQ